VVAASSTLRAGVDYPGSWASFNHWFPDERACVAYLERLRWPDGFVCPRCSNPRGWRTGDGRHVCVSCDRRISVTAGTIFHGTRIPLTTWFAGAWQIVNQKNGVSTLGLQQALGLTRYETAWTMTHRLRQAMVNPARERLSGVVEVDETFVGGVERGTGAKGRLVIDKSIVAIAVEMLEPKGFGRVRMRRVPDTTASSLVPFVTDLVEPGSVVLTDGWKPYRKIVAAGYEHRATVIAGSGDPAHVSMPGVHRVAALAKRWLLGTHQGAVSGDHLDAYLDEFAFRFNRRRARSRGLLFYRLIEGAVRSAI
jgi:transposase-like protein